MAQDWALMIRRSFGIPDLVGDEIAAERLRQCVGEDIEPHTNQHWSRENWDTSIDAVIAEVCSAGEGGRLDGFLAGLSKVGDRAGYALEALAREIATKVAPESLSQSAPPEVAWATRILERVQAFVRRYPFEGKTGRYFGGPRRPQPEPDPSTAS